MKNFFCTLVGVFGSFAAYFLGGWNSALKALILFMVVDFVSGLAVAGIFKKSDKSGSGALESKASFKGLCKKCMMLAFVAIGYRLDMLIGGEYIKDAICIGFCCNELISITENAGIMGVPIPGTITKAIDILKDKESK